MAAFVAVMLILAACATKEPAINVLPEPPEPPAAQTKLRNTLCLVIDDAGLSLERLRPFLELDIPLTIAVMPQRQFSRLCSFEARRSGKEVIMHQPMQPEGSVNPGAGAVLKDMAAEEIRAVLDANLRTVPGAVGLNNHMGSAATSDRQVMNAVLQWTKERGLFFVDSLTTPRSVVREASAGAGVPYIVRNVFLDNRSDSESIRRQFREGMDYAARHGTAVMIGHVRPNTAVVLREMAVEAKSAGFVFAPVSAVYKQRARNGQ